MKPFRILLVDDDLDFLSVFQTELTRLGFEVNTEAHADEVIKKAIAWNPDVIVLDWHMPEKDGLQILMELKQQSMDTPVIMLSGQGDMEITRKAFDLGIQDFLTKPARLSEMEIVLKRACIRSGIERENRQLKRDAFLQFGEIIGSSVPMHKLREVIKKTACSTSSILITGEKGTGKEIVARYLQRFGPSPNGPFVTVNCSQMQPDLLMAELFGHAKGAFSGANNARPGLIEEANNGTLFLDKVSATPLDIQTRLLSVLENGETRRLGENETRRVQFRVLAATHKSLRQNIEEGLFRQDLYYALTPLTIKTPPLRDHLNDIPELINAWNQKQPEPIPFLESAIKELQAHDWPGNVRELKNSYSRLIILCDTKQITNLDVEDCLNLRSIRGEDEGSIKTLEQNQILRILKEEKGDRKKAAKKLGISLRTLYYRLKKYQNMDLKE